MIEKLKEKYEELLYRTSNPHTGSNWGLAIARFVVGIYLIPFVSLTHVVLGILGYKR